MGGVLKIYEVRGGRWVSDRVFGTMCDVDIKS
jgi:hypothetical protein